MARPRTAHEAALDALIAPQDRDDYLRRREALLARNATLEVIDSSRAAQHLNKRELAARAGLEASSVRRMLTARTANPTVETTFRLLGAVGVGLEAVLPNGERVSILESASGKGKRAPRRAAASR